MRVVVTPLRDNRPQPARDIRKGKGAEFRVPCDCSAYAQVCMHLVHLEHVVVGARVGLGELAAHRVKAILVGDQVGLNDKVVKLLHLHVS